MECEKDTLDELNNQVVDKNQNKNESDKSQDDIKVRMKELIKIINEANEAYYGDGEEIISNKEYECDKIIHH